MQFKLPSLSSPDPFFISNLALRVLAAALAALLCWLLAGLLGQLLAWQTSPPALRQPAPSATDNSTGRAALARWFARTEASAPASNTASLQLIAVVAGKRGVALIGGVESSGPVAVETGKEIRPGLRLAEVNPDRIVLDQAGTRSELTFPKGPDQALISPAGSVPAPPAVQARPAPAAPLAASPASSISRGQLAGVARGANLADWDKGLENFAGGGIRVTDTRRQPLAQTLNLRNGDVIKRVNDRDITQLAEISLIYHHFSQSQEVALTILRDGKPQQLNFKIQP